MTDTTDVFTADIAPGPARPGLDVERIKARIRIRFEDGWKVRTGFLTARRWRSYILIRGPRSETRLNIGEALALANAIVDAVENTTSAAQSATTEGTNNE